jgi:hypothetical protein
MSRARDWTKLALRKASIKRWKRGLMEDKGIEPTEEMHHSFSAGFNMGYESHKTKRLKE